MTVSEWDQRQLCPDGTCTGVIGPDGTCKTCGRVAPDWGEERRRGMVAPADDADDDADDDDEDGEDEADDEDEISPSAPAALGEAAEWNRRQLCPDGGCVGVIGPDGTCKVCGTPAPTRSEAKAAAAAAAADDDAATEAAEDAEDASEDEDEDDLDSDHASDDEDENEDDGDEDDDEDDEDDEDDAKDSAEVAPSGGDDLGSRRLCSDGACIGVIGPDGKCKVCGKDAA